MKRRNFIRNGGLGLSALASRSLLTSGGSSAYELDYSYGTIDNLDEIADENGLVALRIAMSSDSGLSPLPHSGRIKVSGARVVRMKEYFFEAGEDTIEPRRQRWELVAGQENIDVMVVWLETPEPGTRVVLFDQNRMEHSFRLEELLSAQELTFTSQGTLITTNFLSYRETGTLDPRSVGISDPGGAFSFAVMADPQGGDPAAHNRMGTRIKIHNAFVEETVELVNRLEDPALFTIVIGDIVDGQGPREHYARMLEYLGKLEHPVLFTLGNHETRYRMASGPGYNMEGFNNYFAAQKAMNGMEKLLYSFDLGRWHLIAWPDPLRRRFWETHPHYFDWLERDLEANRDKPVIFFQHIPIHPVGIDPMTNYVESPYVKRLLFDLLSRHGNVRYVLSGHVHIPVKSSFKTACSYKGMNLINLPAAGYRPRGFGEQDYAGGPAQGAAVIHIDGDQASIRFRTITGEVYRYPDSLPEFKPEAYPLWLTPGWNLPAAEQVVNGGFENGLTGWARRYVYAEDRDPSSICEVQRKPDARSYSALYLYNRTRGYQAPGQDRLPQAINKVCQAVAIAGDESRVLQMRYMIDGTNTDPEGFCGGYLWVEGYRGPYRKMSLVYSAGIVFANVAGAYSREKMVDPIHMELDDHPGRWMSLEANLRADCERGREGTSFAGLKLDRLVINLGTWTINDGPDQPFGWWIDDVQLLPAGQGPQESLVNGRAVKPKPPERIWWMGKYIPFRHLGGEHRYHKGTSNNH